jgi:peptidoglycan/LPS O-acetylase OafA/YrhL
MAALLPLIGGVLLARFVTSRTTVIAAELVFYALAATVLIATAPDHGHSYGSGVILSIVLAPLCVLAVVLGSLWQNRRANIQPASS